MTRLLRAIDDYFGGDGASGLVLACASGGLIITMLLWVLS